jgi:glycogen(starch) synthase
MTRILHVLDHSLPEQSGYAFRSHSILGALAARGVSLTVLTSPKQGNATNAVDEIDGIAYRRTALAPNTTAHGVVGQLRSVQSTRAAIRGCLRSEEIQVVHAHSPCLNGLAALGLGIPLVYEMRSSWEDAAVSSGITRAGSIRYRLSRALETFVAKRADEIVVICEGLRDELTARGVPAGKITVVPNALSADMFELPTADAVAGIRARYGLKDQRVIGFFGSFFEWEGLDTLIEALPLVLEAVPQARLLLVGGGRHEAALKRRAEELSLGRYIVFAGRVSHDEVRAFYGAADVAAYPRLPDRLTHMVTPLKPLEAMAQRRPVVASDVGGHRQLIRDGETGYLFSAGDRAALASRLIGALRGTDEVAALVARARDHVERAHRWSVVARGYLPVYERVQRNAAARRGAV